MEAWMRRHAGRIVPVGSKDQSWHERIFARDTPAALLGGYLWPPKSYPCSFCRREFRSAQALGGHMNVHRRDRARLRQSSPGASPCDDTEHHRLRFFTKPDRENSRFGDCGLPTPPSPINLIPASNTPATSLSLAIWGGDVKKLRQVGCKERRSWGDCEKEEEKGITSNYKIRRSIEVPVIARVHEDLDLELRLGRTPKVNDI